MSKEYEFCWAAHPNIYNNYSERNFNVYFSEPDGGVNEETGILLLIPGFGGDSQSNVYKKMRSNFADKYNVVTVQCDYFGQEFMQGADSIQINASYDSLSGILSPHKLSEIFKDGFNAQRFLEIAASHGIRVSGNAKMNESLENFNDMGIMQAIDNITAVCYIIQILKDNNLTFNASKVILFGQSHGAYLSYLCNAFAPHLFTLLIDNSSWLFPVYLKSQRYLFSQVGNTTVQVTFDYLASKQPYDVEILDIAKLYKNIGNKCDIQCYHGTTDNLISHIEKRKFCDNVAGCTYHEISQDKVDGRIFKSTTHGLDADFLELFHHVMECKQFEKGQVVSLPPSHFRSSMYRYKFNYETGIPLVSRAVR